MNCVPDNLLPIIERPRSNANLGRRFEFKIPPSQKQFEILIYKALENPLPPPYVTNSKIGRKFGRLEVIAFSHIRPGNTSSVVRCHWVVLCKCGNMEMRSSRKINDARSEAMCAECHWLSQYQEPQKRKVA